MPYAPPLNKLEALCLEKSEADSMLAENFRLEKVLQGLAGQALLLRIVRRIAEGHETQTFTTTCSGGFN